MTKPRSWQILWERIKEDVLLGLTDVEVSRLHCVLQTQVRGARQIAIKYGLCPPPPKKGPSEGKIGLAKMMRAHGIKPKEVAKSTGLHLKRVYELAPRRKNQRRTPEQCEEMRKEVKRLNAKGCSRSSIARTLRVPTHHVAYYLKATQAPKSKAKWPEVFERIRCDLLIMSDARVAQKHGLTYVQVRHARVSAMRNGLIVTPRLRPGPRPWAVQQ